MRRLFLSILILAASCRVNAAQAPVPAPVNPGKNAPKNEAELPELPRGKLDEGIFVQSGDLKIPFADVEKIVNLFLIAERKKSAKYVPSFDTLLRSRLQVAEILLRNAVLEKYARDNKLAATPEELEQFLKLHKKVLQTSNQTYEQWLSDSGMSDADFRRFQSAKIPLERQAGAAVTEQEIEAKFNELKIETPLRSVAHVLFQFKGADSAPKLLERTKDEARKMAEDALAQAKAGKDFAELARKSDDDATRANGGAVDWFPLKGAGAMVDAFGKAAYAIGKVGEHSPVVETPYGYHIIKLTGLREDEFRAQIRTFLANQKYKTLTEPLMQAALEKALFSDTLTRPEKK